MFAPYVVVGCLDMNKEFDIWKICVRDGFCVRCGKCISSQGYSGVLCEKCNEMWVKFAIVNGLSSLNAEPNKEFWYKFIDMNPSYRE
jgi:hypothetical protein